MKGKKAISIIILMAVLIMTSVSVSAYDYNFGEKFETSIGDENINVGNEVEVRAIGGIKGYSYVKLAMNFLDEEGEVRYFKSGKIFFEKDYVFQGYVFKSEKVDDKTASISIEKQGEETVEVEEEVTEEPEIEKQEEPEQEVEEEESERGKNADIWVRTQDRVQDENSVIEAETGISRVKLTPYQASDRAKEVLGMKFSEVVIVEKGERTYYKLETKTNAKLLGFIPIGLTQNVLVDAESGDVGKVNNPWYAFLTTS